MKVTLGIDKFAYHPIYVILVVAVIIPLQVGMVISGQVLFGIILFLMQVPWLIFGFMGKFEYTAELLGIDV